MKCQYCPAESPSGATSCYQCGMRLEVPSPHSAEESANGHEPPAAAPNPAPRSAVGAFPPQATARIVVPLINRHRGVIGDARWRKSLATVLLLVIVLVPLLAFSVVMLTRKPTSPVGFERAQEVDRTLVVKEQQLTAKDQELARKDQQLADKDRELADKEQMLADKDQKLADKDQKLADKDQKLAAKDRKLVAKNRELATTQHKLDMLEQQLASVQVELKKTKMELSRTEVALRRVSDKFKRKTNEYARLKNKFDFLTLQVSQKTRKVIELQTQIASIRGANGGGRNRTQHGSKPAKQNRS